MCLFGKKVTFPLSEILKGLQQAVSSSVGMLQTQQINNLSRFWTNDGQPVSRKVQAGGQELDVPLFTLVPHRNLEMEEVEIKFKTRIGDIAEEKVKNVLGHNPVVSHADLQMSLSSTRANADDLMEITVRFKMQEAPEGLARLADEYNKQI